MLQLVLDAQRERREDVRGICEFETRGQDRRAYRSGRYSKAPTGQAATGPDSTLTTQPIAEVAGGLEVEQGLAEGIDLHQGQGGDAPLAVRRQRPQAAA